MATVKIKLAKIIADTCPTVGMFEFTDLLGNIIAIHEKLPVIGVNEVDLRLPQNVQLDCKLVSTSNAGVVIDISKPHGVEDTRGQSQFEVSASIVHI